MLYGKYNDRKFQLKFYSIIDLDSFQSIIKRWVIVKQYYQISNSLSESTCISQIRVDGTLSMNELSNRSSLSVELLEAPLGLSGVSSSDEKSPLPLNFEINSISDAQLLHYYEYRKKNNEHLEFIHELLKESRWKVVVDLVLDLKKKNAEILALPLDQESPKTKPKPKTFLGKSLKLKERKVSFL